MSKQFKDLYTLQPEELMEKLKESRIELIKLKGQARMAASQKDVAKIRNLKKVVAQINYLLKNKTGDVGKK